MTKNFTAVDCSPWRRVKTIVKVVWWGLILSLSLLVLGNRLARHQPHVFDRTAHCVHLLAERMSYESILRSHSFLLEFSRLQHAADFTQASVSSPRRSLYDCDPGPLPVGMLQ